MAAEFLRGADNGPAIIGAWEDLSAQMTGSFRTEYLNREPRAAGSTDDHILQELGGLNPKVAPWRDYETGEIDYDGFYAKREELLGSLTSKVRTAYEKYEAKSIDADLRAVEPQIREARTLRSQSYDMPRYFHGSKSDVEALADEKRLDEFTAYVRQEVARAKREYGPDFELSLPDAARILAKRDYNDAELGDDAALVFQNNVKANPKRDDFLIKHADVLARFFPDLYRRKALQERLSDELFEAVIR